MSDKVFQLNGKKNRIRTYLDIVNLNFDLTSKELDVLEQMVLARKNIRDKNLPFDVLDTQIRRLIEKKLEITNIGVYIQRLKTKGVIKVTSTGTKIHKDLIPDGISQVIFKLR